MLTSGTSLHLGELVGLNSLNFIVVLNYFILQVHRLVVLIGSLNRALTSKVILLKLLLYRLVHINAIFIVVVVSKMQLGLLLQNRRSWLDDLLLLALILCGS